MAQKVKKVKKLPAIQEIRTWVRSLGQEDLLEKGMATQYSILPGKSHGQRSLVGYSLWVAESDTTELPLLSFWASLMAQWVKNLPAMQETQKTCILSLGCEDPLQEEMVTYSSRYSSILGWKIPWTQEPGGL